MQTQEYKNYMRSEAWEAKKRERIAIDGGCCMCGRPLDKIRSVQVHHKNLGNENVLTDICTLCGSCHKKIHNFYNRRRE